MTPEQFDALLTRAQQYAAECLLSAADEPDRASYWRAKADYWMARAEGLRAFIPAEVRL